MHLVVQLSTGTDTVPFRDTKTVLRKTVLTKTVLRKTVLRKTVLIKNKRPCNARPTVVVCANVSVFALHDSKRPTRRSLSLASFVLWQSLLSALS